MIDKKTQKIHKTKWEPKRSIVSKIRKTVLNEYKKSSGVIDIYGNLEKPSLPQQFDKFTELAAFLMDSEQTVKQLVKLNAMLVKKAKKLGLIDINTSGNFILASYKKDESYRPHRKLLRSVLEEELKRFGFGSEFVKLIGFVPPTVFREMLRNKLIPKDSGVSPYHGEFTHALQWLMIAWQHEDTGFLAGGDNDDLTIVSDIFKAFGEEDTVYERRYFIKPTISQDVVEYSEKTFWDSFLDTFSGEGDNFNSPNNLNNFLLNTERSDLSFLKSLIESRFQKRTKKNSVKLERDEKYKKTYPPQQYTKNSLPFVLFPNKTHASLKFLNIETEKEIKMSSESSSTELEKKTNATSSVTVSECFAKAKENLGKRKFEEALDCFIQARDLLLKAEECEPIAIRQVCLEMATISYHLGRFFAAETNLLKALNFDKLCQESGKPSMDVFIKEQLGIIQHVHRYVQLVKDKKDRLTPESKSASSLSSCIIS